MPGTGVAQAGRAPDSDREVAGSNPDRRAGVNARASAPENTAGLTGVAHRSVPLQLTDGIASPDRRGRQWQPLRYASAAGSSVVERGGDLAGAAVPASPALQAAGSTDRPGRCSRLRAAVKWYSARVQFWARKMGAGAGPAAETTTPAPRGSCPQYLAKRLRAKAAAYRARWERYLTTPHLRGETPWHTSMRNPVNRALWRLAVCETGGINGGRPLWTHHNAVYSGALGFAHSTWARWRYFVRPLPPSVAARANPAQQLAVGRALVRTFGGYSSWPSCSRRLGLR